MQRKKELDLHTTDLSAVITPDNVQYLGENIAICALKHAILVRGMRFDKLYYDLIRDIHCKDSVDRCISDGYDFAQTAICFLCEHMGRKLGDTVIGKYKKPVTIRHACASEVGSLFYKRSQYENNTIPVHRRDKARNADPFDDNNAEKSLENVENIIAGMNLNPKQRQTLEYYMQGKGVCEISRLLSVATCTVWRYRTALQEKYLLYMARL